MKKNQCNRSCNSCSNRSNSKVGDSKKNSNATNSELSFEKNAGIITDNEYEISSELCNNSANSKNKKNKKRSK
ncbi:MAG: hypothetical protein IJ097_04335 [Bacilli bacterium]|nr:hypothetical protein [Bacilli bacterium]